MNWIQYNQQTGTFINLTIPSEVANDPQAHCNSPEGKKHVAFSDEFMRINHDGDQVVRKEQIDALMDKYGYKRKA